MALLNRFSKLNDRGETGVFTFIVTKSVTRDFHRDATTKDFCFGYHRWAISFQRPTEKVLGVHLLLRNASPSTACVVDFTLTLLNREHFSENQVYSKRQAKFTITNPMQGVSRWIQMSELVERRFSNETGEFLFELSLSNMTTIFECDIQMGPSVLNQYKSLLKGAGGAGCGGDKQPDNSGGGGGGANNNGQQQQAGKAGPRTSTGGPEQLINLETNCFTFGSFDWSLTIVPLVVSTGAANDKQSYSSSSSSSSSSHQHHQQQQQQHLLTPNKHNSSSNISLNSVNNNNNTGSGSTKTNVQANGAHGEPVCRVYLNRLNGFDTLCRVKYRVILGHHQVGVGAQSAEFVDSKTLDQMSDSGGRIRGYQFRNTNILKLVSVRSNLGPSSAQQQLISAAAAQSPGSKTRGHQHHSTSGHQHNSQHHSHSHSHHQHQHHHSHNQHHHFQQQTSVDLRVHIEMFCANTVSEAKVALHRKPNEAQLSNCSDRNKQAWCVESDDESGDTIKLKLFFMDLQSVPRNHIRYISWIAYLVRRDAKSGLMRDSQPVKNAPHSNYYMQDGIDMGAIMETDVKVKELTSSPNSFLDNNQLTVHIEWVDSLLLFSHLYNNYDALATVQRHQISRELDALQAELEYLEKKHEQTCKALERLSTNNGEEALAAANGRTRRADQNNEQRDDEQSDEDDRKGASNGRRSPLAGQVSPGPASHEEPSESDGSNSKQASLGRRSPSRCSQTKPITMSYQEQFVAAERDGPQNNNNNNNLPPGRHQQQQQEQQQQQWPVSGQQARVRAGSGDSSTSMQINSSTSSSVASTGAVAAAAAAATPVTSAAAALSLAGHHQHQPGYQSKPASPIVMSQEERVKFSSSTPPYLNVNYHQQQQQLIQSSTRYTNQSAANLGQQQQPFAPPPAGQSIRRRLPVQPTVHQNQLPVRHSAETNIDRRDSLSSLYHLQQLGWKQQQQQQQQLSSEQLLQQFYQQQQQQQPLVNNHQRQPALDETPASGLQVASSELAINGPLRGPDEHQSCPSGARARQCSLSAVGQPVAFETKSSTTTTSISFDARHKPAPLTGVMQTTSLTHANHHHYQHQQQHQQQHFNRQPFVLTDQTNSVLLQHQQQRQQQIHLMESTGANSIERRRCSLMLVAGHQLTWTGSDNGPMAHNNNNGNSNLTSSSSSSCSSGRPVAIGTNSRRALSNFHVIPTSTSLLADHLDHLDHLDQHQHRLLHDDPPVPAAVAPPPMAAGRQQIYSSDTSLLVSGLDGPVHATGGLLAAEPHLAPNRDNLNNGPDNHEDGGDHGDDHDGDDDASDNDDQHNDDADHARGDQVHRRLVNASLTASTGGYANELAAPAVDGQLPLDLFVQINSDGGGQRNSLAANCEGNHHETNSRLSLVHHQKQQQQRQMNHHHEEMSAPSSPPLLHVASFMPNELAPDGPETGQQEQQQKRPPVFAGSSSSSSSMGGRPSLGARHSVGQSPLVVSGPTNRILIEEEEQQQQQQQRRRHNELLLLSSSSASSAAPDKTTEPFSFSQQDYKYDCLHYGL